jgi:Putative beta-barrel porin-2, OmpL-like. bbp2
MKKQSKRRNRVIATGACVGMVVGGGARLNAQSASGSPDAKITRLEQQNQQLQKRLDVLETMAQKEGLLPSGTPKDPPVSAMSRITLSGFVTASFFHDSSKPTGGHIPGYLWNTQNDSFSLNKVKLTLASPPVQRSGDKFDAAYRVSLIAGQDAPFVNTSSKTIGFDLVREAYVEMNVPVGTGLNVRAGELISLLNYESGDGGAANDNFSQGNQWFLTGNPPDAGVQLGYSLTDWLDVKVRVQNGMYTGPVDVSSSKTFMGAIDLKPTSSLWLALIGFGGREDLPFVQSLWGGSLLDGWQATSHVHLGTELDYFSFRNPAGYPVPGDAPVWSAGLWSDYSFNKQVDVALRGDFVSDKDGVDAAAGGVGAPLGWLNPLGTGQDLASLTLTLNYKPLPFLKLQPEIRMDHTSWSGGFVSGKQYRFIFGGGASYLF